jgi:hypothetical protein
MKLSASSVDGAHVRIAALCRFFLSSDELSVQSKARRSASEPRESDGDTVSQRPLSAVLSFEAGRWWRYNINIDIAVLAMVNPASSDFDHEQEEDGCIAEVVQSCS